MKGTSIKELDEKIRLYNKRVIVQNKPKMIKQGCQGFMISFSKER